MRPQVGLVFVTTLSVDAEEEKKEKARQTHAHTQKKNHQK